VETNLGQATNAQGEVEYRFITSDANEEIAKTTVIESLNDPAPSSNKYYVQVDQRFKNLWGKMSSTRVKDVNDNIIRLVSNTYAFQGLGDGGNVELLHHALDYPVDLPGGGTPPDCSADALDHTDHTISLYKNFPVKLITTTLYESGTQNVTENVDFDPITGQVTEMKETDASGTVNRVLNTPAYQEFPDMGAKSADPSYKNLLGGSAEQITYRDEQLSGNGDFLGRTASRYTNQFAIRSYDASNDRYANVSSTCFWMPFESYVWTGDLGTYGLHDAGSFAAFDHGSATQHSNWRLNRTITLLSPRGHILERRGFNNRFSGTKYCYDDRYRMAEVPNTNYASFSCTGFEDLIGVDDPAVYFAEGEVAYANGVQHDGVSHTGKYSVKVEGSTGPTIAITHDGTGTHGEDLGLMRGRTYRVSVWAYVGSAPDALLQVELDGSSAGGAYNAVQSVTVSNASLTIGDWKRLEVDITVPADYTSVSGSSGINALRVTLQGGSGTAYFDDLRCSAIEAPMTVNVFDKKTGRITEVLDQHNIATRYIYDASGRVAEVWQEVEGIGWKKMAENVFHYHRSLEP
ncbi:MAG: carbohydrate binding domain-containing protein, partial [Bacteroidota bacterium]